MLCSQAATFHIQLIRSRWHNDSEVGCNSAQESFLVAQKFEMEELVTMSWSSSVPYLNTLVQSQDVHYINYRMLDERKLYGQAWDKARAALTLAVRRHDYNFIAILDKYIEDCQGPLSSDSNVTSESEDETDNETKKGKLDSRELMNPQKRKARGRPKETDRMQRANEPSKKAKRQLRCKICGDAGHNRVTCSQRKE
ncbi:hypothetical protein C2G38_2040938 [Gigaspora rosea]|uniref:CCHC-type domain-containing protein n=1 Tax=Gigaspora rosea TaxID=44941 RepID=A0A397UXK9_9GLOM|nr:hypothetical protein C2G38_2040938 [Gigaspora rosea]